MLLTNGLLTNDVLVWKSIGAAVWLAAITVAASAVWSLTLAPTSLLSPLGLLGSFFSLSAWFSALALVVAQAPAFAAQAAALCSREPRPAHAHRLLQCPAAAAPAAMLLAKLAGRVGSAAGAARAAAFLGLHTLSAALFLSIHSASRSAPAQGAPPCAAAARDSPRLALQLGCSSCSAPPSVYACSFNWLQALGGLCSTPPGWQRCTSCTGPTGGLSCPACCYCCCWLHSLWLWRESFSSVLSVAQVLRIHAGVNVNLVAAIAAASTCPACRSQDVLLFPSVQRHRYFRIKQRLPGAAAQAAKLTAAAFSGAAATTLLRGGGTAGWPLSLPGAAGALLGGSLCVFCWLIGSSALEVVFTERLRPDDYSDRDALAAMSACLGGKKGDLMQGLALHDARCAAGLKSADDWRQQAAAPCRLWCAPVPLPYSNLSQI